MVKLPIITTRSLERLASSSGVASEAVSRLAAATALRRKQRPSSPVESVRV